MSALTEAFAAAEAAGIKQHRIQVGDLLFNVARFGKGRRLLLLHGWPEFWLVWRPVMERLGLEFELIAPDLRGCGDTGKPFPGPDATATADRHAGDMFGLMDALDIKRFGVVGGDLGAYVAQAMSHRAPERLEGSFYFCTPYPGLGFRYGQPSHLIEVWYQYLQQLPWAAELVGSSREACRIYFRHFLDHWSGDNPKVFSDLLEAYVDNFMKPGNIQGGFDWYLSSAPNRRLWLEGKLPPKPPINVPTRFLWGRRDPLILPNWSDRLGEYWTNYSLDFADAGHYVHAEVPDVAAREIRAFFSGLRAQSAAE
ncbi:alpha/beta hydrolase [Bradyrhizobium sp. C-145]|uniref:alpha/beta fold hydrolase n=1 Tax=Bradyrhizobium sp. C-145 TaxID=574727 RepID=UPI00201B89FC|nr:alpha/beta hydrolase [Bradyrhizobium sp. C-145]UQR66642.1 alpha/beta hydrolase [Bradyrhizobium sp. C-145]